MSAAQLDLFGSLPAAATGWDAPSAAPDLPSYDWVLINSSAGKDSMATLSHVLGLCDAAGVDRARIVVAHADLGRVEWPGARQLAETHAATLGLRFEAVRRDGADLLDRVLIRNGPGRVTPAPPRPGTDPVPAAAPAISRPGRSSG
jgi:hypothetical protein